MQSEDELRALAFVEVYNLRCAGAKDVQSWLEGVSAKEKTKVCLGTFCSDADINQCIALSKRGLCALANSKRENIV